MTKLQKIFLIVLVNYSLSCSHYILNEFGYPRPPKNQRFLSIKNITYLKDNELIDTTAIYYLSNSNYYRNNNEYKNSDNYIRFYSDGHYKLQVVKEYPKIDDINNIGKGNIGFYKLKDSVVELHLYSGISAGSDQLEFGIIDENKNLIILNENPRTDFGIGYTKNGIKRKIKGTSFFNPKVYVKTKLLGMTYDRPNW